MKLVVISLLISMLLAGIAISMNRLLGMNLYRSVMGILNPFKVMEPIEIGILFGLWGIEMFVLFIQRKSEQ